MTERYVDALLGNDTWDGLSKVFTSGSTGPKATCNGAEDTPTVAGDIVHVRTGSGYVYRESLTCDVSGSSGNPIEFRADVMGVIWAGGGGHARLTGSDNDQTATRASCITGASKNYRTFRGFCFDLTTSSMIALTTASGNWIVEDCYFQGPSANANPINYAGIGIGHIIRRCIFMGSRGNGVLFTHSSGLDNSGNLIENCLFNAILTAGVIITRVGGVTVKNCTFVGCTAHGIRVLTALTAGQTTTVRNNIFYGCTTALQAVTSPGTNEEITENYNSFSGNSADRSNVSTGANSNTYPPLFSPPHLYAGLKNPWNSFDLSEGSPVRAIAGSSMSSDGLYGIPRPATDSKKSWGAIQYDGWLFEASTVQAGAGARKIPDAGRIRKRVQVTDVSTTVSVYVRWQADYAGTKPQMIIKQPGQSDITITATGAANTWELLTTTFTPAANPPLLVIQIVSNNTATSGSYAVFVDTFSVT